MVAHENVVTEADREQRLSASEDALEDQVVEIGWSQRQSFFYPGGDEDYRSVGEILSVFHGPSAKNMLRGNSRLRI